MDSLNYFLFGLHCHQPVGNFDFVFEEAYQKAYLPFVEVLEKYPNIKTTYHFSAPILQYCEKNHFDFIEKLRGLVKKNQIEIVGGGFYEPILAMLSHCDRKKQILNFTNYLEKMFATKVNSLWLTERVWDNSLIEDLVTANIKYVFVDDYHFLSAGIPQEKLQGYFLTEKENQQLAIFPISQQLRYLVPFALPEKIKEFFLNNKSNLHILFDDGEKFGVWPGTHKWVYDDGWIKNFFNLFNDEVLPKFILPEEYFNNFKPEGFCFLPSCSYFEMGEWSLPAEKSFQLETLVQDFKNKNIFEENKYFLKGGIWENFFVKYAESFYLYKKMHYVSEKIMKDKVKVKKEVAEEYLFKAQCNDVYWHGVFGGLYLPHLRHSAYQNLINAEKIISSQEEILSLDLNLDKQNEIYLSNKDFILSFFVNDGGTLNEFSIKNFNVNLGNTLMRRQEAYHLKALHNTNETESSETKTIHEINKTIPQEERKNLAFDKYLRRNFRSYFLTRMPSLEECVSNNFLNYEVGNFSNDSYEVKEKSIKKIIFNKSQNINLNEQSINLLLEKIFLFKPSSIVFSSNINNSQTLKLSNSQLLFALEFNFAFPCCNSEYGEIYVGKSWGNFSNQIAINSVTQNFSFDNITFADKIMNGKIILKFKQTPQNIFGFPVYTFSQSESGLEKIFQQYCIMIFYDINKQLSLEVELKCQS